MFPLQHIPIIIIESISFRVDTGHSSTMINSSRWIPACTINSKGGESHSHPFRMDGNPIHSSGITADMSADFGPRKNRPPHFVLHKNFLWKWSSFENILIYSKFMHSKKKIFLNDVGGFRYNGRDVIIIFFFLCMSVSIIFLSPPHTHTNPHPYISFQFFVASEK
jgi:hypothetical protein